MVDTILYDWDGCLVQTLQMWLDINLKHFKKLGVDVTRQGIIDIDHHALADELSKMGIKDPQEYIKELVKQGEGRIRGTLFHRGVVETLNTLKEKGFTLGIVTSGRRATVNTKLEHEGLKELFDTIVTVEDVEMRKPDPEPVNLALQQLGKKPEQALIIGDSGHDINAGKAAGIKTCLFMPKENLEFYDHQDFLALKPDYVINEHKEILEKLRV